MPTIRIDDEVWNWLKKHARPLEDTPNTVLRRLAGLETAPERNTNGEHGGIKNTGQRRRLRNGHTSLNEFRVPILLLLHRNGGQMERQPALRKLEKDMGDRLTDADHADIESGTIRWEKTAEWQVYTMRKEGLLEPVTRSGNGVWKLTTKGAEQAAQFG
ncbi:MAG TPA: winged helix-turn-helix domain-containing protein [Rhodanobacteraceae bacterium]|nr:winged helix-turn-helix domain-containing protein [Rhodanobacteraceae bacterium]